MATKAIDVLKEKKAELESIWSSGKFVGTLQDYKDQIHEIDQEIWNWSEAYIGLKDSIIDMVQNGINAQLDALKDLIDKYKKALANEKNLYEYQRRVADQTKKIASIQKQIAALTGNNSEEARAKLQKLNTQLEEAQQDLRDTEYDKWYEDQTSMLDDLQDELEKAFEKMMLDQDEILKAIKAVVDTRGDEINGLIKGFCDQYYYNPSNDMNSLINNQASMNTILNNFVNSVTSWYSNNITIADLQSLLDYEFSKLNNGNSEYDSGNGGNEENHEDKTNDLPDWDPDNEIPDNHLDDTSKDGSKEEEILGDIKHQIDKLLYSGRSSDMADNISTTLNKAFKELTGNQAYVDKTSVEEILKLLFGNKYSGLLNSNGNIDSKYDNEILSKLGDIGFNTYSIRVAKDTIEQEALKQKLETQKVEDAKSEKIAKVNNLLTNAHTTLSDLDQTKYTTGKYGDPLNKYLVNKYAKAFAKQEKKEELLNVLGITPKWKSENVLTDTVANKAVSALKTLGFEKGGIVPGHSLTGDKVLARVNSRETILTSDFTDMLPMAVHAMEDFNKLTTTPFIHNANGLGTTIGDINVSIDGANITDPDSFVEALRSNPKFKVEIANAVGSQFSNPFGNKLGRF